MRIYVRPRYWIERQNENLMPFLIRYSVISIYSSGDCSPILSNLQTVLKLQFDDITKPEPGLILFTDEMAEKIIDFADYLIENFPERPLIVHCDAGVSRSGAVGSVLNDYINMKLCREDDRKLFWKEHRNLIVPNYHVELKLLEAWKYNHNDTKGMERKG